MAVLELKTTKQKCQESVLRVCEKLLELAKSGEITEIVVSAWGPIEGTQTFANDTEQYTRRVGMAYMLLQSVTTREPDVFS